jgi:hypothetical protein
VILGMNLVMFVLVVWMIIIAIVWCIEHLPDVFRERRATREKNIALEFDSELTVKMPGGSFDPDETMRLTAPKIKQQKNLEFVFFIPAKVTRRRHAKA